MKARPRLIYPKKQFVEPPPKPDPVFVGHVWHEIRCITCGGIIRRVCFRDMAAAIWFFRQKAKMSVYARPIPIQCKRHGKKVTAGLPLFQGE